MDAHQAYMLNALTETELATALDAQASLLSVQTAAWLRLDHLCFALQRQKVALPTGVTPHALASAIVDFQSKALSTGRLPIEALRSQLHVDVHSSLLLKGLWAKIYNDYNHGRYADSDDDEEGSGWPKQTAAESSEPAKAKDPKLVCKVPEGAISLIPSRYSPSPKMLPNTGILWHRILRWTAPIGCVGLLVVL